MALNENVQWLYDNLKGKGIDLGTPDEFNTALSSDKATQDWAYKKGKEFGFDLGTPDEFLIGMGIRSSQAMQQSQEQRKIGVTSANPSVKDFPAPTTEAEYQESRRIQDAASGATNDPNQPFVAPQDDNQAYQEQMLRTSEAMRRNAERMAQRTQQAATSIPQPSLSLDPQDGSMGAALERMQRQRLPEIRKQTIANNMLNETAQSLGELQRADREKWMAQGENMTPTQRSYLAQAYKEDPYLAAANSVLFNAEVRMQDAKRQNGISWRNIGEGLASFGKDTGRHLLTKLEGMASFGMSDLRNAKYQRDVLKKVADANAFDNPDAVLTPQEKALYDATVTNIAVEIARQNDTSRWSKAGQITADMIPFIEDIMLGNALFKGFGDAGRKAITKGVEKYVKNKLAKWLLTNVGDVAISAGESAATAAILPHTYANMYGNMTQADMDKVGMDGYRMTLGGVKEQSAAQAWGNAYRDQVKELFTETGGNFRLIGRALIDNPLGKKILKTPFGMVLKRFEGAQGGAGSRFASMTMYHGVLGEWLEELEGAIYDGNLKEFFTADTQLPMLLSFSVPAAFTGGLNAGQHAYLDAKYKSAGKTIDKLIDASEYVGPDKNTLKGQIMATLYQTPTENLPQAIGMCVEQVYPEEYKALMEGAPEKDNKAAELAYALKEYLASGTVLTAFDPDMLGGQIADVQAHREQMRQQATEAAQATVQNISHEDGNIYRVTIKGKDDVAGYAFRGDLDVVPDKDGAPTTRGRDLITIKMDDGTTPQVPADELVILDAPQSAQERIDQMTEHYFAQYANNDLFHVGDKVYLKQNGQQSAESSTIVNINDDGVEVEIIGPDGMPNTTVIPHEQAAEALAVAEGETEDNIVTYVLPDNTQLRLRKTGDGVYEDITPDGQAAFVLNDEDLAEWGAQPLVQEEAPANTNNQGMQTPVVEQSAYPQDNEGNPAWGQMEVPQSAQVLYDLYKGNRESAKAYADDQLKEAQKVQKAASKQASHNLNLAQRLAEEEQNAQFKAQADAAVKYWEDVKLAIAQIKTAEEQAAKEAQQLAMQQAREQRSKTEEGTTANATMAERYNAAPKIIGNAGTTTLPDGRELSGRYMLIAPQGVTPSHDVTKNFQRSEGYPVTSNGQSINDRDYTSDKEEQQKVVSIAQNFNGNAIKNMPVISDEGLVYNGNGRMMAGQLAAINGTDAAYTQSLMNNAAQYGFTPEQVASIPNARVVFQLDERLPYSTQSLAIFNEQETQTQSNTGKAAGYARKLTPQAVSDVLSAVDGFNTIDAFFSDKKAPFNLINNLINAGIIAQREKAEMVDGDKLSATGRERLSNILFGTVFDNETIRLMGDDAALKNSILRALPQILDNKSLGEFSLESDINDAIRLLYQVRNSGMPFRSFVSQTVIAEDGQVHTAAENYSPYQLLLAEEMSEGGVDAFRDVLTAYNNEARNVQGGQVDIFGDLLTPTELKNLILQRYGKEPNETERAAQTSPEAGNAVQRTPASNEQAKVTEPTKQYPKLIFAKNYYKDQGARDIAHGIKEGNLDSINEAAADMYEALKPYVNDMVNGGGITFIPIPSRKGKADSTFKLATLVWQRITDRTPKWRDGTVDFRDVLEGNVRESLYELKKAGKSIPEGDFFGYRITGELPQKGTIVLVDGVYATGATMDAARKVVGSNAISLVYAYDDTKAAEVTPEDRLAQAEAETDTNPTEAQKKAENYKQGHVTLWGLPITIENPKGSIRRGTDANGKQWEQEMHHTYGKIRRTEGVDGDHIDVFIGPNLTSDKVFVVDQRNVDTGEFDEHKCMLGFDSLEEAQNGYLSNYEEGWQGMGTVTEVTMDEFKKWIDSSHRKTKPFAEYKSVKTEGAASTAMQPDDQLRKELAEELRKLDYEEQSPVDVNLVYDIDDLRHAVTDILTRYNIPTLQSAMDAINTSLVEQRERGAEWVDVEDEEAALIQVVRDIVGDKATPIPTTPVVSAGTTPLTKMSKDDILNELQRYAAGNLFNMTPRMAKRIISLAKKYGKGLPEEFENMASNAKYLTDLVNGKIKVQSSSTSTETQAENLTPLEAAQKRKAAREAAKAAGSKNTIFTDEAYEKAKARMKARLNRLNMGIDPEMVADQIVIAGYHVERGARKFAEFARALIADFGDGIRQYARQMYNFLRDIPQGEPFRAEMDDYATVMAFDIDNFDKNIQKNAENAENILINQNNFVPLQPNEKEYAADGLSVVVNTKDYTTYLTPQAKEVFAKLGQKERKPHKRPELSYISFASRDGVMIPLEVLKSDPAIIEAQAKIDSNSGTLELTQEQIEEYANRLLEGGDIKSERKAFIIIGRPAGGKSSVFAEPLAEKNSARIIDSDEVKPWLDGYDNGDGAGYVQKASDRIMQEALWRAALNGDNVVIPKIGGGSIIDEIALPLKELGYTVEIYYNEVAPESSYMRAMARFAEKGRYLSLNYLESIGDKPTKTFNNYSTKDIYGTISELSSQKVQDLRARLARIREMETQLLPERLGRGGRSISTLGISELLESGEPERGRDSQLTGTPLFDHYEWKNNDVPFGSKPKTIKQGDNVNSNNNNGSNEENSGRVPQTSRGVSRSAEGQRDRLGKGDSVPSAVALGELLKGKSAEEQHKLASEWAKEHGILVDFPKYASENGLSVFANGNENDNWVDTQANVVYKMNNLMNSADKIANLIERVELYNEIFPETKLSLWGFSSIYGSKRVHPIYTQQFIDNAEHATQEQIDDLMRSKGFEPTGNREGEYSNGQYVVSDALPKNAMRTNSGIVFVIDADVKRAGQGGGGKKTTFEKGQKVKYKNKVDGKLYDATIDSVNADGTYNLLAPNPVFGDVFMGNISEDRISPIEQPKEEKPMSPMQRQFKSIKEQYPDAVLLFRVGDFYELYDTDAEEGSKILGITLTRTTWAKMAGFPFHALDTYLPKLVRAGKRVAICDQLEDPKKAKGLIKRGVSELVTPGTPYQETPKVENTEVAEPESVTDNQEPTIPELNVVTDTVGEITESKHTKTGNPIWIVKPLERVSDDEYKVLKARAKENNGYYSRFVKGFVFNSVNDANRFNNISDEQTTTEQTSADTEAIVNEGQSVAAEAAAIERDRRDTDGAEGEQRTESTAPSTDAVEAEITTRQEAIDKIDGAVEKVEKQLALLGYYEADKSDPSKWNEAYGYRKTAEDKAIADADKLAKQLADDLGIEINKRKKLSKANIPPAGGDISFRLPLKDGKELYFQIDVNPNWDGNWYRDTGNSDDLVVDHIMWRIEDPNATGSGRYGDNHQLGLFKVHGNEPFQVTYEEVLRDIRVWAKDYLPEAPKVEVPKDATVLEAAKARQEATKKKKADKNRIPDGQQVLDLFADAVDEINDGIAQENSTPAIEEQTEPKLVKNQTEFTEDDITPAISRVRLKDGSIKQVLMVAHTQDIKSNEKPKLEQIMFTDGTTAKFEDIAAINVDESVEDLHHGYKIGDKVLYKGKEEEIVDFEKDGRPVLNSFGTSYITEIVDWEDIKPANNTNNGTVRNDGERKGSTPQGRTAGQPADQNETLGGSQRQANEGTQSGRVGSRSEQHRVHDGERGLGTAGQRSTESVENPVAEGERKNTRNFRYDPSDPAPTSNKARYEANLAAIRLLKQLQDEGRQATPEEQRVLAKFTGWGGLGEFFKGEPGTTYWSDHGEQSPYQVIKELLTDEEMQAAQLSRNSAYFTPPAIIDELWNVAKHLGFKGGNILEGSAGIGNILAQMPQSISDRSNLQAVEIDSITAGILAQLYPDAQVHAAGFQEVDIPNNSQDLVITNVPFVTGLRVYDKKEKDLSKRFGNIHDFCIAKNVRKLRQGGIGIFITSSGTLDNSKDLRCWLNNEGETDVIGAFRLNRETFGGTSATSDIIVVRKRVNGQKDPRAIDVLDTEVARVATPEPEQIWDRKTNGFVTNEQEAKKLIYNRYFVEHPESMGGEMGFGFEHGDTRWGGTTSGCYPSPAINQSERLQEWVEAIPTTGDVQTVTVRESNNFKPGTYEEYHGDLPYGSLVLNSKDEICRVYNGMVVPVEGINPTKVKGHTKAEVLKDYNTLKAAVEELLAEQAKGISDEGLKGLLKKLNRAYDDFVKKYGNLNRNVSLSFLRNDVQWASMAALENVRETIDKSGKKQVEVSKTDVFSKRVVGVQAEPKAENARDGVILSVQQYGNVRPDMIAMWLERPQADVEKEIIESRLAFRDPQTGNMVVSHEYLSGNVREKLAYAEEHNENGIYDTNIEELRKVIPVDIPAHLIEFNIGSTWIPVELYHKYLKEKFGVESLQLVHVGSAWISNEKSYGRYSLQNEKNRSEGVYSELLSEQVYGHQLMIAAMNNVPVVVSRTEKHRDGTSETITDKAATAACSDKISQIKDDFVEWARGKMQEDSELAERVQKIYNERFNAIVPMLSVDKAFLSPHLPGQNHKYTLYDHQQQAVVRATTQPVMLAHEVGTGKTITLISSAMEMRRLGTAKKPMIVVQNATTPQFVKEAKDLYPNAKILTVSERDRTKEGRQEFYAKIKYNDWDLIIVPQSVFDMIPDSESRMRDFIQEKIDEKMHAIEAAKEANVDEKVTKRMEKELEALQEDLQNANMSGKRSKSKTEKDAKKDAERIENAKARAEEMLDRRTDEVEDFDDMGIDALLIDEAHNYKHLGFATMMTRGVKGIDPSYSKRAAALYLKCQSVYERCGHRNVVFATGTPISNTAAEIWTFMKYLMPKEVLKDNDIYYFDDFVHNFGKIAEQLEFATNGKFKANNRFAQYGNVPELMRIWLTCADCVLTREVGQVNDKVPELEGGKAQDIFLPQSPSLIDIMASVRAELERYEQMSGKEKKENSHIPLTMYGVAKRAAIDPRLVDANAADEPLSKTNKAVEETLRSLKETKKYNGTVAIFCDSYRNQQTGFNLFEDIKAKLVKGGVPAAKIAIIRSEMTDAAKQKIFDAVREGEIRVIMGSTQTLGTGVNIQTRLHTLIHMDAPDRPMDYTQRNGRIIRQGNMHRQWNLPVRVLRFGVEDSLDVTSYQRLKTKAGFIDSIMNGKSMIDNNLENRVLEDVEEGIFDNPVAMLSGSQYALLKSQAERDLRKWQARKQQHDIDQILIAKKLKDNAQIIEYRRQLIATDEQFLQTLKQTFPTGNVTEYNIDGTICHNAAELKEAVKAINADIQARADKLRKEGYEGSKQNIAVSLQFNGMPFNVNIVLIYNSRWESGQRAITINKEVQYTTPTSDHWLGSPTKVLDKLVEHIEQDYLSGTQAAGEINYSRSYIERLQQENELMRQREGKPFEHSAELEKAQALVDEYTEKMQDELAEKEAKYANMSSGRAVTLNEQDDEEETPEAQITSLDYPQFANQTEAQQLATAALVEVLNDNTYLDVFLASDEDVEAQKKSLAETATWSELMLRANKAADISSNDGAKLLKNIETTKQKVKNISTKSIKNPVSFISDVLGLQQSGSSYYETYKLGNGDIITLRVSNHNATISNFDNEGETDGVSIVISNRPNTKVTNDGKAHIVEYFYRRTDLLKAYGTPIADILGSIKTLLETGKYTDTTGLAQVEEVNIPELQSTEYSIRTTPAPKKTGIGYKVFYRGKDGKLYPPMVANPNGEDTPVGVWLNADAAPVAGESKTGRPQVKAGGKGTQGGSGTLAYRPGWHLGEIPYALQFNRKDENGEKTLFPKDFVWAEVEYAADNDYQEEAMREGVNASGKFQHSLAGLKHVPTNGFYRYRTNPNPATDPWIITGAMKVNRVLTNEEVDDIVRAAGREPQVREAMLTPDGTLYGWAIGDRIYLTKDGLNPNSPIHEYSHIWAKAMMRNNREGWQSIVDIFKGTPFWDEVVNDPNYQGLTTDDAICSEVLARYSGQRGAARMEEWAKEEQYEAEQSGSLLRGAKVRQLINRAKKALADFWHWVGVNLFGIKHFDSAKQVADRVLYDMLNQTELGDMTGGATEAMISGYTQEKQRIIKEWYAAHPRPTYNYGETLKAFEQRLFEWEAEYKKFREQLKNWKPMPSESEKVDNPESNSKPAFVPGVRPTPMSNETPSEYALRLRQYYQLMRDERLVAEYVAEINNQADAAAKVLKKNTLTRSLLDAAKPIENFQEWMQQHGATITDESNAYTDTFLATGRVTEANEQMQRDIIRPLAKQIAKIIAPDAKTGKSRLDSINIVWHNMDIAGTGSKLDGKALTPREIIGVYCQAKDCAEAIEKGLPDRGAKGFLNNLGMSHDDIIAAVESSIPRAELDELWRLINAATHFALNYDYESGRISEDTHTEFYQREFYVPQRGWRERDESGLITEYEPVGKRGNDPYNAALVKAHGRQSLASDPFAYIMSIDASSIVSSENNKIKQKFLQFCLDNENLGLQTGAFRVKKYWIMNVIDPETGKIKLDEEGNPMMEVSYVAPTAEDLSHDRTIKELIKKKRKEWAKVNKAYLDRQSHGELGPQLEAAYKIKLSKIEQAIEDLEQQIHIAWNATNTNITQRTSDEKKQHEVRVLLDGQEYLIEVQDEKLANAINKKFKQHQEQLFNTSQKMRNATRFMSAVLTQYNPEFAASNFARDFQVALATLTAEHPELVGSFLKNFAACQPAVWQYAFNDKVRDRAVFRDSELGRYLQEYFKAGAATGFSYMQDLKSLRQDFDAMVNESNLRRGIKGAVGTLSMLTQVSETAVRFAGYVSARQKGIGINEAAYLSKELTTNFDRAGEVADSGWMSWFSFFRATLNGNIKFLKALKKMPLAYSLIAAAYVAMGMLNQFLNPDDPEDEVWAGDFTRESNFVIGKWRIPTAHFLRMFFAAGVNAAKWMQGEKSFGEATYNTANFASQELLPNYLNLLGNGTEWNSREGKVDFTWEGLLQGVMPSPVSPIADVYFNRDFRGATINREPFAKSQEGTKDILLSKENTLPVYKWLTQAIYEGVGGNMNAKYQSDDPAWRSWLFDTSASSVEHVVEGYMPAGMDMFITLGEAIYDTATGTPTGPDKWPFVRKFYNAYTPERAYMQQYYLLNGRVKEFKRNMDDYRKNDRTKYNILTHSQEYRNYQEAERLVKKQKENPTTADVQTLINANKQWIK